MPLLRADQREDFSPSMCWSRVNDPVVRLHGDGFGRGERYSRLGRRRFLIVWDPKLIGVLSHRSGLDDNDPLLTQFFGIKLLCRVS